LPRFLRQIRTTALHQQGGGFRLTELTMIAKKNRSRAKRIPDAPVICGKLKTLFHDTKATVWLE
jgi:Uma2 family endonuclease